MNREPTTPVSVPNDAPHSTPQHQPSDQPGAEAASTPKPVVTPRRFMSAEKLQFLHFISIGMSVAEAARRIGFSPRAIYKLADRDPDFKARLRRNRTDTRALCMNTLTEAASNAKNWRCIPLLLKLTSNEPSKTPAPSTSKAAADSSSPAPTMEDFRQVLAQIARIIHRVVTDPAMRAQLDSEFANVTFQIKRQQQLAQQRP